MDEIQLYGKEGLFHQVVKKSAIMNGRYGVIVKGGDLNLNNVLTGIELPAPGDTYPGVFCLPPISVIKEASVQQAQWECFYFQLLFLCTTGYTGDNQIKAPDPSTNTSLHRVNMDWSDMKAVAFSFMNTLERLQVKLRNQFRLGQKEPWKIIRLSKLQNANLSGVLLQFQGELPVGCEFADIDLSDSSVLTEIIDGIAPTHEKHFH
jgi:hypothetical protein